MKIKLFTVIILFLSFAILAGAPEQESPFSVTISTLKSEYVMAEPVCVIVTLTNVSKESVKFHRPDDFYLLINAKNDEGVNSGIGGEGSINIMGRSEIQDLQNDGSCTLPPGSTVQLTRCGFLKLLPVSSTWEVWAEFSGRGSFVPVVIVVPGAPPQKQLCEGCWKGKVESKKVTIRINQPTGLDLEAYNFFKGNPLNSDNISILLQKYPTSTYAGYTLLGNNGHPWPLLPVEEIKMRGCSMRSLEKFPDHPEIRPQMEEQEKRRLNINQDRADKLKEYLNARPDFVYADFMRLELATRLAYLERYNEAQALCEELIRKAPDSSEAKKAKDLLDYLATNGWIKEKEASVQKPLSVPQTTK